MKAKGGYFEGSNSGISEHTSAVVPLVSENEFGEIFFIGTAFYISPIGILMTAKHNLFSKSNNLFDNLGIFHFLPNNQYVLRAIKRVSYSNEYDIAYLLPEQILDENMSVVSSPSLILTDELPIKGEQLGMYAYPNSRITKVNGERIGNFWAEFYVGDCGEFFNEGFSLLRNPCFQTTIKIKSGASGGPVFNKAGHVFAVCSTGIDVVESDENISFVTPILPSFNSILEDDEGAKMTISELIEKEMIPFKQERNIQS